MSQGSLFVESLEEALRDAINALKGPKEVGVMLWPSMKADLAGRRINQCLDPERDEKLSLAEVLLIAKRARAANCHTVMAYLASELDYEPPKPVDPETAEIRERREIGALMLRIEEKIDRFNRRDAERQALRRVA